MKKNHNLKFSLQHATTVVKEKYQRVIELYIGSPRSDSASTIKTRNLLRKRRGNINLLYFNECSIEYKYFSDYNELTDRLRLLVASRNVGNETQLSVN